MRPDAAQAIPKTSPEWGFVFASREGAGTNTGDRGTECVVNARTRVKYSG
jgi:hypothetical protein